MKKKTLRRHAGLAGDTRLLKHFSDGLSGLVFWSFRYFLGRQTIHAHCFARELAQALPDLAPRDRQLILKELDYAVSETLRLALLKDGLAYGHPFGAEHMMASWQVVIDAGKKYKETL